MMSTDDTKDFVHLITNFISNLSEKQQENLLNGYAEIKYCETHEYKLWSKIKKRVVQCNSANEIEKVFEGFFKKGIILFCEFYGINANFRDTKQSLYQKIAIHFKIENRETKLE